MDALSQLPFLLPERPPVTQIRGRDARALRPAPGARTQAMAGFEDRYTDIVDYIVRITDEIWIDRAIGLIRDTYADDCTIYSSYGVVRSVEDVIASTVTTINAFPDGRIHHLAVAWSGDDATGFYTSHLGHSRSTNVARTGWGPATGRRSSIRFAADCISKDNRIHTEWLVRDNGAQVRQFGFDVHDCARRAAQTGRFDHLVPPSLDKPQAALGSGERWARDLFDDIWTARRLDRLDRHYAPDAIVHAGGGRQAQGPRDIGRLFIHVQAAMPDALMHVENICLAQENDGVIVAVRWLLTGTSKAGGVLGDCPEGASLAMMGISHLRIGTTGAIVEEWMIFDEVGVLAQAYAA